MYPFLKIDGSKIYRSWFKIEKQNIFELDNSKVRNSRIVIKGKMNKILFSNCQVSDSIISVTGDKNIIQIAKEVNLRKGNIIIRGNNCIITIAEGTTFGGIRIINVGTSNTITIGKECLFSDQIEIWASDTHAIYSDNNMWVNKEKPVIIGNRVWVGSRAIILKGVKVGDGAIVGMGAVLTKDVNKKTIVAGNPAKVIRENIDWSLDYPYGE